MSVYVRPRRPRRVQLSVPGASAKMMEKAAASAADHVFLDLEDAVAPRAKVAARSQVVAALRSLDWRGKTRCVRINDLRTRYAYADIIEVVRGAGEHLDTLMLTKVLDARDIWFVETLLEQLELDLGLSRPIGIEALIEEVEGLLNVERIAAASPRLEALILGVGDYSASQKMDARAINSQSPYPGDIWHYGRFRLLIASRAHGIDPVDGPYPDFRNLDGYREECRRALALGCAGKWAIHPAQIPVALEVFTPPAEDVARARRVIEAYREAELQGLGSIQIDGEMVDAATIRILRNVLERADVGGKPRT
jgi:citrate lyase subunit beta / citryl-CoA lyase